MSTKGGGAVKDAAYSVLRYIDAPGPGAELYASFTFIEACTPCHYKGALSLKGGPLRRCESASAVTAVRNQTQTRIQVPESGIQFSECHKKLLTDI